MQINKEEIEWRQPRKKAARHRALAINTPEANAAYQNNQS